MMDETGDVSCLKESHQHDLKSWKKSYSRSGSPSRYADARHQLTPFVLFVDWSPILYSIKEIAPRSASVLG